MATPQQLFRIIINKILPATDFSPESANALQGAVALGWSHAPALRGRTRTVPGRGGENHAKAFFE